METSYDEFPDKVMFHILRPGNLHSVLGHYQTFEIRVVMMQSSWKLDLPDEHAI